MRINPIGTALEASRSCSLRYRWILRPVSTLHRIGQGTPSYTSIPNQRPKPQLIWCGRCASLLRLWRLRLMRIYTFGYSQGGHAAMASHKIMRKNILMSLLCVPVADSAYHMTGKDQQRRMFEPMAIKHTYYLITSWIGPIHRCDGHL